MYPQDILNKIGFKSIGKNVMISDKCSIYNPANISIGDNVRIDDFAILSAGDGGIEIGNYVHIACYVSIIGQGKVTLEDYVGLSGRVSIYSSSDDFSGEYLAGPTIPKELTNVTSKDITIGKYTTVGVGSTIFSSICENCGIGAMTLVNKDIIDSGIYMGIPAKFYKKRYDKVYRLG